MTRRLRTGPALAALLWLLATPAPAQEGAAAAGEPVIQLRTIAIIGNRELPKTLVIVPWKDPVVVPVPAPDIGSVLDQRPDALDASAFDLRVELFRAGYVLD